MGLIAVVLLAGLIAVRPLAPSPAILAAAAGPVSVTLIALVGLGVWLVNPYLALLLAPVLHAWVLLAPEETAVGSLLAAAITLVALVPVIAAVVALADRFGVGWDVVWQLLMLIGDGQIGIVLAAARLHRRRLRPRRPGAGTGADRPRAARDHHRRPIEALEDGAEKESLGEFARGGVAGGRPLVRRLR